MIDVWEERLVLVAIAIMVALTGWIFLFLVPEQFDREDKARDPSPENPFDELPATSHTIPELTSYI
jgi:hypothetical protein